MSVTLMSHVFNADPSKIKSQEKLVLLALCDCANDQGRSIYPSIGTLSIKTALSERSIQRSIKTLKGAGLILLTEKSKRYSTNEYAIHVQNLQRCLLVTPDKGQGCPIGGSGVTIGHPIHEYIHQKNSTSDPKPPSSALDTPPTPPVPGENAPGRPIEGGGGHSDTSKPPIAAGRGNQQRPALNSWLTDYAEEWERATKGSPMAFGQAGKVFKDLEARFGRVRVLAGWRKYCATTNPEFLSLNSFHGKAGIFMPPPESKREYVTESDMMKFISSR